MSEGEEELNVGAVRLEEVASAANVSLSTASKALRGKPHVSEKTRIRVIDAARRLGYSAAEAMASIDGKVKRQGFSRHAGFSRWHHWR